MSENSETAHQNVHVQCEQEFKIQRYSVYRDIKHFNLKITLPTLLYANISITFLISFFIHLM